MLRRLLSATCIVCLFAATVSAQTYKIKLDRPEKAGEKYRLNATVDKNEKMTVTANGMVVQNRDRILKATMQAVVENQKVDDKGHVLKKRVMIEKLTDGKGTELLKKGQVLVAETVDGKTKHQLADGGTLEGDALSAVKEIIKTHEPGKPSVEDAFGTDKPRKVGESWKVKGEAASKALGIPADAIQGAVKLEKIVQHAGEKCLQLSTKAKLTAMPNADQLKKQGIDVKSLDFQITMSGLLPVDSSRPVVSRSATMSMKADMDGPNGVKLNLTMKFSGKRVRTPLK